MGKVCFDRMKKLSNGIENQQNKDLQMRKMTLDGCMIMVKACFNLVKKLSNGSEKLLNKAMQMKKPSYGSENQRNKDMQMLSIT
uniref:Uncharacterized protein n=1 Tax=Plectus sambesii TaxID=2011161 RepID=A0A914XH71_9BILA